MARAHAAAGSLRGRALGISPPNGCKREAARRKASPISRCSSIDVASGSSYPARPSVKTEWLARSRYDAALAGVGPEHPDLADPPRRRSKSFASAKIPGARLHRPINVEHLEAARPARCAPASAGPRERAQVALAAPRCSTSTICCRRGLLRRRRTPRRGRAPRRAADRRAAHRAGRAGGARRTLMRFDAVRRCGALRAALDWTRSGASATLARARNPARSRDAGAAAC